MGGDEEGRGGGRRVKEEEKEEKKGRWGGEGKTEWGWRRRKESERYKGNESGFKKRGPLVQEDRITHPPEF